MFSMTSKEILYLFSLYKNNFYEYIDLHTFGIC